AHEQGVLHRDIKPAHLLIDVRGNLWITDFGLAQVQGEDGVTRTGDVVGTLRYMSPEQALARRGVVDQRTDIYSLGVTLYELLTLQPAFDGRDHQELLRQIALDEPVPPRRLNPAVPRALATLALKAMAKDLSTGYARAQELAADLRRFLDDRPIQASRPGPLELTLRWARRHWEQVATAAAIGVLSLIVGTTLVWLQARETQAQATNAETVPRHYRAYIIETYPLLDRFAIDSRNQAGALLGANADAASRQEAFQVYEQALRFFRQVTELAPSDAESRVIIARAGGRLGFTHFMLSSAKGTPGR